MPNPFEAYQLRVKTAENPGGIYFEHSTEGLTDAIKFAQSCYSAECIERRVAPCVWELLWREGDLIAGRPGCMRLVPYEYQKR
jgi:hypothetical protein